LIPADPHPVLPVKSATTLVPKTAACPVLASAGARLDSLDATRAFVLVLGVVFHASLSFMPIFMGWAVQDISTQSCVVPFVAVSHAFRMETFFLLAGFFSHGSYHRKGFRDFIRSRWIRIVIPFVLGWFLLRPLMVSGWIMGSASLRGDVDVLAGLIGGFQSLASLPAGIFTGSHLWFLYYLILITALTLLGRGMLCATDPLALRMRRWGDAGVRWVASSKFSLGILALPTAAVLLCMNSWGMDTPDRSLVPHLPALCVYGGFFVLGWMLDRQRGCLEPLTRWTLHRWILAGIGVVTILSIGGLERDPAHPWYRWARVVYVIGYALTLWTLTLLTIGGFRKFCSRPNAAVRYIADSAYWMYLIHLPVVVWLQVAVAEWPFPGSLKLVFISVVTLGIAWVSYDLFVRSTWIGWILQGRRMERVLFA